MNLRLPARSCWHKIEATGGVLSSTLTPIASNDLQMGEFNSDSSPTERSHNLNWRLYGVVLAALLASRAPIVWQELLEVYPLQTLGQHFVLFTCILTFTIVGMLRVEKRVNRRSHILRNHLLLQPCID